MKVIDVIRMVDGNQIVEVRTSDSQQAYQRCLRNDFAKGFIQMNGQKPMFAEIPVSWIMQQEVIYPIYSKAVCEQKDLSESDGEAFMTVRSYTEIVLTIAKTSKEVNDFANAVWKKWLQEGENDALH